MDISRDLIEYFKSKNLLCDYQTEDLCEECARLNMSLADFLGYKGIYDDETVYKTVAGYYNIPYADVDMLDVDKDVFSKYSLEYLKLHLILPFRIEDGVLYAACAEPYNAFSANALNIAHNGKIRLFLSPASQISRYLDTEYALVNKNSALDDLKNSKSVDLKTDGITDDVPNNPSVKLVDSILREAIPNRASDIHIEPGEKRVRVRYRIDGDLQEYASFPIEYYKSICARLKIISSMDISEHRIPQDGRIDITVAGNEYDLRVSTLPTVHGEKFVIRILDKNSFRFSREMLGFNEKENEIINKMLRHPHGIILLTGPTGCGKSTTLYSFLKELNNPNVNIVTVEDPVEYTMEGISQTQVNTKANMSFAKALRSILRQDPDIIMLGEIRDEETAEIAVRAAITGHLVFSTLHTNGAPDAIIRLEDMGVPDYLLSDAVVGVVAQRLVKKLCPECKTPYLTGDEENKLLGIENSVRIYKPCGCRYCHNTGYKGRIAIHEVMYMSNEIKRSLCSVKSSEGIREIATANGMESLYDSYKNLVLEGVVPIHLLTSLNENQ